MSLETGIKNLLNNTSSSDSQLFDSQLLSVRVPPSMVNQIDELASELNKTRSYLVMLFINEGVSELLKQLNDKDSKESFFEEYSENNAARYFLLNTNYNNSQSDHYTMLENNEASAFYNPWKKYIENLRAGDIVFLYQSGHGICGYGVADEQLIIRDHNGDKDEWYSRKLNDFVSDFEAITAKKCKEITKSNHIFRRTLVSVNKFQGEAIISAIIKIRK